MFSAELWLVLYLGVGGCRGRGTSPDTRRTPRPRVTEFLTAFERKHLIARDGRQMIVMRDRLEKFLEQSHPSSNGK
jgi:hypothetical protein